MISFTIEKLLAEDSELKIAPIQRRKVWQPVQVELLWDSILRGFPIGVFIAQKNNGQLELIDGLQRLTAIRLGHPKQDDSMRLFYDLLPQKEVIEKRVWHVRAISNSHPWGYNLNDEQVDKLSANEIRAALSDFGKEGCNPYASKFDLSQAWPYKAGLPIPLEALLTEASSPDCYKAKVIEAVCRLSCQQWQKMFKNKLLSGEASVSITKLYEPIRRLWSQEIPVITFSLSNQNQNDLDLVFRRIANGGTPISADDLLYSSIKAYFGNKFKNWVEGICEKEGLPEHVIATLIVQAAYIKATNKPVATITIDQIKKLPKKEDFEAAIRALCNDNVVKQSKDLLSNGERALPNYIIHQISLQARPIFVLLFILHAFWPNMLNEQAKEKLRALAFVLLLEKRYSDGIVGAILSALLSENGDDLSTTIDNVLLKGLFDEKFIPFYPYDEANARNKNNLAFWKGAGKKLLLLYAQRDYLRSMFEGWEPVLHFHDDLPWDYDHIVPRSWVKYKRSDKRAAAAYSLEEIGNLSVLPFSVNRSKSDNAEWAYYEKHAEVLLFDMGFEELSKDFIKQGEVDKFSSIVEKRGKRIYDECYKNLLSYLEPSPSTATMPEAITWRNILLERLTTKLKQNIETIFVVPSEEESNDSDILFSLDGMAFTQRLSKMHIFDQGRRYLGIGMLLEEFDNLVIAILPDPNQSFIEVGIRIANSRNSFNQTQKNEAKELAIKCKSIFHDASTSWWWLSVREIPYHKVNGEIPDDIIEEVANVYCRYKTCAMCP